MYGVIRINGFHFSLTLMRIKMCTILDDNFFIVIVLMFLMGWVLSLTVSTVLLLCKRSIPYNILEDVEYLKNKYSLCHIFKALYNDYELQLSCSR